MLASSGETAPALRRSFFLPRAFALFHHAGVQPFLDVTHDALVRNPVLDELHQPFVIQRVEESTNVRVEQLVHLLCLDSDRQGIQRHVALRPGRNPYEKPRKSVS